MKVLPLLAGLLFGCAPCAAPIRRQSWSVMFCRSWAVLHAPGGRQLYKLCTLRSTSALIPDALCSDGQRDGSWPRNDADGAATRCFAGSQSGSQAPSCISASQASADVVSSGPEPVGAVAQYQHLLCALCLMGLHEAAGSLPRSQYQSNMDSRSDPFSQQDNRL